MIIEISFGAMHTVLDREQVGHRLFGRGLAHGTGDSDGSLAPDFSGRCRQRLERDESVIDSKQAEEVEIVSQLLFFDHRSNCAPAECLLYEVVTVEALAFDSEEEFAGLHGAGIDGISLGCGAQVALAGRSRPGRTDE